ncbi:MAG: hypothetical protein Q9182_005223 [Xanthomendoza sp. 2 TL-2023]
MPLVVGHHWVQAVEDLWLVGGMEVDSVVDLPEVLEQSLVQRLVTSAGHISRECTAPNGGPLTSAGKACYKCGQPGHISRECTVVETNGAMGLDTAVDPINQVQTSATAAAAV